MMARARLLKPGFFSNEELVELDFAARLLFAGLWTIADREGRLEDRPKRIKMAIFPADNVDVDAYLATLTERGFLNRYAVEGARFIQIVNFVKHQTPHHREPESLIPAADGTVTGPMPAPDETGTDHVPALGEPRESPGQALGEPESSRAVTGNRYTETVTGGGETTTREPAREAAAPLAPLPPASERQVKHRAMFAALATAFGEPAPGPETGRYERAAKDLVAAGVDPAEVPDLYEAWEAVNPGPPRVNSLAGQLNVLRKATLPNGTRGTPTRAEQKNARILGSVEADTERYAAMEARRDGTGDIRKGNGAHAGALPAGDRPGDQGPVVGVARRHAG